MVLTRSVFRATFTWPGFCTMYAPHRAPEVLQAWWQAQEGALAGL